MTSRRTAPVRVGIEASCWSNNRGYGRHLRSLVTALVALDHEREYTLITDSPFSQSTVPQGARVEIAPTSRPVTQAASSEGNRSLGDMWRFSRQLARGQYDILLFPTIYSFVPTWTRARTIVFIHDVIPERFPELTLPSPRARLFWKLKSWLGRRSADAIVTVSEYSRDEIARVFGISKDQIHVVGEASDPKFARGPSERPSHLMSRWNIPPEGRTILFVGGFGPHKNLGILLKALADLVRQPELTDVRLLLVGQHKGETFHSEAESLQSQIDRMGLNHHVLFTGYLDDEELVDLFHESTVLALPSLAEGFGLPAVEAAACGTPVVATTASPLPQLLAGGGIFVDPDDADGWRNALMTLLTQPLQRERMGKMARAAADRLSWQDAARQMMSVLSRVQNA